MYSGGVAGGVVLSSSCWQKSAASLWGGLDEPPIPWTPPQQDSAGAEGEGGCLGGSEGSPVLPGWGKEEVQHRQPPPCPPRLEGAVAPVPLTAPHPLTHVPPTSAPSPLLLLPRDGAELCWPRAGSQGGGPGDRDPCSWCCSCRGPRRWHRPLLPGLGRRETREEREREGIREKKREEKRGNRDKGGGWVWGGGRKRKGRGKEEENSRKRRKREKEEEEKRRKRRKMRKRGKDEEAKTTRKE